MDTSKLAASAKKYRKELLFIIMLVLTKELPYFTIRKNIRGEETGGTLSHNAQLAPYKRDVDRDNDSSKLTERKIKTYLGQCFELFEPLSLKDTIYGNMLVSGKDFKESDLYRAMLASLSNSLGESLVLSLFNAVRNPDGKKTMDLFDGFDSIIKKEITDNSISAGNGNLYTFTTAITNDNALDLLKFAYRKAHPSLKGRKTYMHVPFSIYEHYTDDYAVARGGSNYNKEFEQTFVEGSRRLCEIVPFVGKSDDAPIVITTKKNVVIGLDNSFIDNKENIEVRRDNNPNLWQYVLNMYFGTEFNSIDKRDLFVAKQFAG